MEYCAQLIWKIWHINLRSSRWKDDLRGIWTWILIGCNLIPRYLLNNCKLSCLCSRSGINHANLALQDNIVHIAQLSNWQRLYLFNWWYLWPWSIYFSIYLALHILIMVRQRCSWWSNVCQKRCWQIFLLVLKTWRREWSPIQIPSCDHCNLSLGPLYFDAVAD